MPPAVFRLFTFIFHLQDLGPLLQARRHPDLPRLREYFRTLAAP